jgi:hypothetical protein
VLNDTPYNLASVAIFLLFTGCGLSRAAQLPPSRLRGTAVARRHQWMGQIVSCPSGQTDVMPYFAMAKGHREVQFMNGELNPICTEVFRDQDFAPSGYWVWLKSAKAHGFDVKAFDHYGWRYVPHFTSNPNSWCSRLITSIRVDGPRIRSDFRPWWQG